MKHTYDTFGDVTSSWGWQSSILKDKQQEILANGPKKENCKLEAGEPFVKATYRLEGDGSPILSVYEELCTLCSTTSKCTTQVLMLLQKNCQLAGLFHNSNLMQGMCEVCLSVFQRKVWGGLEIAVSFFKCALYFDPAKISQLNSDIDKLHVFLLLDSNYIIDGLKSELPCIWLPMMECWQ